MSTVRGLVVHGVVLALAAVAAVMVWTKEDHPTARRDQQVEVWKGPKDRVTKIVLEAKKRTVTAEARKDKNGPFFVVTVDREVASPPRPKKPEKKGDGGADEEPEKKEPAKRETKTFISVKGANDLAAKLAPLMAFRAVGKIEDTRAEEFGFHESKGTVHVWVSGKEHTLTLGGSTPGGADRYVKVEGGEVFVVEGAIARDLETAESRLMERNLHGFEADEVKKAKLTAGGATRELVRTGKKRAAHWANPATPDTKDETAGNWMSKVERLRATQYVEGRDASAPDGSEPVVRIDYFGDSGSLGYLELVKVPSAGEGASGKPKKDEYFARSEQTRWFAKVTRTVAEQVAQDVGSVVK